MGEAEPGRGSSHGLIDNFYLSHNEIANESPSRLAGVSADAEIGLRCFGCDRVQRAVLLLRLPQAVAATGQVLLHRFYCKESLTAFDVKRVAMAATWLATKLEETPRQAKDLLRVFARINCRAKGATLDVIDPYSKNWEGVKQSMFKIEKTMLRVLGFVTHVEHPHKFVLSLITILGITQLQQEAWNLANDSLRTTLCVRFKCEVVACGIIFLAARRMQMPMPEKAGEEWWQLCSVKRQDVLEVAHQIQSLYSQPPAAYIDVKAALAASAAAAPSAAAAITGNAAEASLANSPAVAATSPAVTLSSPTVAPAALNGGGSGGRSSSTADRDGEMRQDSAADNRGSNGLRREERPENSRDDRRRERRNECHSDRGDDRPSSRRDDRHSERREDRRSRDGRSPPRRSAERHSALADSRRDDSKPRRDADSRPLTNGVAAAAARDEAVERGRASASRTSPIRLPEDSSRDDRKRSALVSGSNGGGKPLKRSRLSPTEELPPRKSPPRSEARRDGDRRREGSQPSRSAEGGPSRAAPHLDSQSPVGLPPLGLARQPPPQQPLSRLAGQALSSLGASSRPHGRSIDSRSATAGSSRVSVSGPTTLSAPPLTDCHLAPQLVARRHVHIPAPGGVHPLRPPRMKSAAERHLDPLPPLNRGPSRPKAKSALLSFSPPRHSSDLPTG